MHIMQGNRVGFPSHINDNNQFILQIASHKITIALRETTHYFKFPITPPPPPAKSALQLIHI